MRVVFPVVLSAAAGLLSADVPPRPLPVNVSVPAVAAGGLAQIRVTLAAPHRISACRLSFDLDPAVFGPPAEVDVFSATGDQTGVAAINGNHIDLTFGSASGGIGRLPGVPIFVIDVPALASAPKTATIVIPSASPPQSNRCGDADGYQYVVSSASTIIRTGGAVSINSVTPGGGLLPSGTVIRIAGNGFQPGATVQVDGVPPAAVVFVSPREVDVTLAVTADLTGRPVLLTNPDNSSADYYPALHGKKTYGSGYSQTVQPILPQQTYSYADVGTSTGPGFAIQNPAQTPVNFQLTYGQTLHIPAHIGAAGKLDPGETYIYLPTPQLDSAPLTVRSDAPIRIMRLDGVSPRTEDQVGLAVIWDGPTPSCDSPYGAKPSRPCWLAAAGAAPLVTHATVTWNTAVVFTVSATTEGGQWLTTTVANNRACVPGSYCSPQIMLTADPSLPPGDYQATVTVSTDDPTLLPASLAFVFRVASSPISIDAPGYLWFSVNDSIYSRGPAAITVNSPVAGTPFSVTVREMQTFGWLSVTPMQGVTPAVLNVYVNPDPSQYAAIGFIDIAGPANTVTEPVNLVVPNPPQPSTYTLTASPSSLTFWAKAGGSGPDPQVAGLNAFLDSLIPETEHGLSWLSARSVPGGINVSVNPAGLTVGVYQGTVTFSGPDPSRLVHLLPGHLAVTLVVWADLPAISVAPAELSLSAPSGAFAEQVVAVSSANGAVTTRVSAVDDGGNHWLSAAPDQIGSLAVHADATQLPPGAYSGSVQFHAPPESPFSTTLPVTFNVTPAPPAYLQPGAPLAASLLNAASQTSGAVAPREIVTILGLDLGPHIPASYQLDSGGNIATLLAGLRVLFDGVPAAMLYVSETQVNAVVPDEVAGKRAVAVSVETNGMRYTTGAAVAPSSPAIFTADSTGRGQALAFNSDSASNTAPTPALRGSTVSFFATGLGQALPGGSTSVRIGGASAIVGSMDPVPGPVAGFVRITATVPPSIVPGPAVPVVLTVGAASSPSGVTIAVQ